LMLRLDSESHTYTRTNTHTHTYVHHHRLCTWMCVYAVCVCMVDISFASDISYHHISYFRYEDTICHMGWLWLVGYD